MLDSDAAEYKSYLESATTRELIKLADKAGIDIPPELDRIFIIRELLDLVLDEKTNIEPLSEKTDNPAGLKIINPAFPGNSPLDLKTASLPLQYHITYLEVLPRDPQWVFVFWEIKAQDRERFEADSRFDGYALKAMENKKQKENYTGSCLNSDFTESFTVPVGKDDNSWYLGFPDSGVFRVALWVRGLDISLIISRPFVLPVFLNSPGNEEYLNRPLIQLSGVSDLPILRTADRVSNSRS